MCVYRPGVRKRQSSGKGGISLPPAKFRLGSIGSRGGEVKYQFVIKKEVLWLGVLCLRFRNLKLFSLHFDWHSWQQVGDECQVNLSFHGWLGSVTERINQTMHYQVSYTFHLRDLNWPTFTSLTDILNRWSSTPPMCSLTAWESESLWGQKRRGYPTQPLHLSERMPCP